MRDAILFDLDGTLWDSVPGVVEAWNQVLSQQCDVKTRITQEQLKGYMGKTVQEIGRLMLPEASDERALQIMHACAQREHDYLLHHPKASRLFDGLLPVLETLHSTYTLCIVSNCESGYIETFFAVHGMAHFFADHTCPGDTGLDKGHNINLVLARNDHRNAIYVGDTLGDERAARFAGIPFVHAAYGFGTATAPDGVAHSLCDLPQIAQQLFQ